VGVDRKEAELSATNIETLNFIYYYSNVKVKFVPYLKWP